MRIRMIRHAALILAMAFVAAAVHAQAKIDLNGTWVFAVETDRGSGTGPVTLKVEGENVTGSSSSQLGDSTVKAGTWKDGKLVFQLEGQNGVISLSATIVEGKLSGEFDYAGQLQGKWVAVKKN